MTIRFTLLNVETQQIDFVLDHSPAWSTPFVTVTGESDHVFNWDMTNGSLLMDGTQMTGYTITIERRDTVDDEVQ